MTQTLTLIRAKQAGLNVPDDASVMKHEPEMLLIGCVDARKDPQADLGIPRGKALILRNIAALIRGACVESTQRETEAAALEFAVQVMGVKDIAVMGHTDCGGIRAALDGMHNHPAIRQYLAPLRMLKKEVLDSSTDTEEKAAILEQEAVKLSVRNLRTYPYIAAAEQDGRLTLHGWVLDTATSQLYVWNEAEDSFAPMG